jgi:cytochrome c
MLDASLVTQGSRPLFSGRATATLVAEGAALWSDTRLSRSGTMSCSTCHSTNYGQMQATFAAPYPHRVAMAKDRAGLEQVNAAEMVQLCMMIPMNNDPLPWESPELAALAAYVESIRPAYKPAAGAGANPCAANPCAANPCAAQGAMPGSNPCAAAKTMNPCAAGNPCAMKAKSKNPCKPS